MLCFPPRHGPASDKDYLPFEVVLDGETRHGSYVDHSHLILSDRPPALWAETIVWFLGLLPAGTPTVAMVEVNPDIVPIPLGADVEEIQTLLDTLVNAD